MSTNNQGIEKAKTHIILESVDYSPKSVVCKKIIKKTTGSVSAVSFDSGEALPVEISPFDTFIQIIDGEAVAVIDDKEYRLSVGESIIIPAHSSNSIEARVHFKMISTVIKSGYEENTI